MENTWIESWLCVCGNLISRGLTFSCKNHLHKTSYFIETKTGNLSVSKPGLTRVENSAPLCSIFRAWVPLAFWVPFLFSLSYQFLSYTDLYYNQAPSYQGRWWPTCMKQGHLLLSSGLWVVVCARWITGILPRLWWWHMEGFWAALSWKSPWFAFQPPKGAAFSVAKAPFLFPPHPPVSSRGCPYQSLCHNLPSFSEIWHAWWEHSEI